jgi:hypothetical protein
MVKLIEIEKVEELSSMLDKVKDYKGCVMYRVDTLVEAITGSDHKTGDEALGIILEFLSYRLQKQLPLGPNFNIEDDDEFYSLLCKAMDEPSLRPKVVEFLSAAPFKKTIGVPVSQAQKAISFDESILNVKAGQTDVAANIWVDLPEEGENKKFPEFLIAPFPNLAQSNLLATLVKANATDVFDTITVRALVDYKWKFAKTGYICELLVYLLFLLSLSVFSVAYQQLDENERKIASLFNFDTPTISTTTIFGIIALVLSPILTIIQEGLQISNMGKSYFKDFWNYLDLTSIFLSITLASLVATDQHASAQVVMGIALYLRWFGFLFYFQAFSGTGKLIRMIIQITIDIRYLLLILVLSILAASFAFNALQPVSTEQQLNSFLFNFFNILILNNGYEPDELVYSGYAGIKMVLYIISMIFVPIILLNLLIALMSDSFENIQDRAFVELNMLRAKIIEEQKYGLFSIFSKRLSTNKEEERYLHVVVPKGENRAKLPTEEYQGVLNAMKRDIGEVKADVKKQVDEVKKQVDDVKTQIDDLKQWMMTHLQRDSVVDVSP